MEPLRLDYDYVIGTFPDHLQMPVRYLIEWIMVNQGISREDFSELKEALKMLTVAQAHTEEKVQKLSEAQDRTDQSLKRLSEAQDRTDESLNKLSESHQKLAEAQDRTDESLKRLS